MSTTATVGGIDRWRESRPLLPGKHETDSQVADSDCSSFLPICIRSQGGCRWIMLSGACLFALGAATALKVINYQIWQNDLLLLFTSLTIGGSLAGLKKVLLPSALEKGIDEMFMFLSPVYFQALTQFEIRTPRTHEWKEAFMDAYFIPFSLLLVSHTANLLSADPAFFGVGEQGNYRPLLEGDCRKKSSFAKIHIPLLATTVALVVLGLQNDNSLLKDLGVILGCYTLGSFITHLTLMEIQEWRKDIASQIIDEGITPTGISEMMSGAYKMIPVWMPFVLGILAGVNQWWGLAIAAAGVGVGRMIRRDVFQREQVPDENARAPREFRYILADALLPFSRSLLHPEQRKLLSTSRKVIDTVKGCFCLLTLVGINLWASYWFQKYFRPEKDDPNFRAQLLSAAMSANISYLTTCSVEALCQSGSGALQNSLKFINDNPEFAGLLYLAFYSYYVTNEAIPSSLFYWMLWSYLLVSSIVTSSKKGKMPIHAAPVIYYLWASYTLVQFALGKIKG